MGNVLSELDAWLTVPLLSIGPAHFTLHTLVTVSILVALLLIGTSRLKALVVRRLLARHGAAAGTWEGIATVVHYLLVVLGFMVILQTEGIDLSALTVLTGALGVGIGFGLQTITNNFVSGVIILLERPIKVGDRIEVGDVSGDVLKISIRATTIVTNDNIAIIVPNSDFISGRVVNWSYTDRSVRFTIPVGVSYDADPEKVRDLLLGVAAGHPAVLKEPAPDVLLKEFADSSINLELRVWSADMSTHPLILRSDLNYAINRVFRANNIEIPYPQRDLHLRTPVELPMVARVANSKG